MSSDALKRQNVSSGKPWESIVGYSRAVRVGCYVHVAGTVGADDEGRAVSADPYEQARKALQTIEQALKEAGASMSDVVRTRMFVTDITQWESIGRAHGECFRDIRPAASMIEVKALIGPDLVVEIEADAIVRE